MNWHFDGPGQRTSDWNDDGSHYLAVRVDDGWALVHVSRHGFQSRLGLYASYQEAQNAARAIVGDGE